MSFANDSIGAREAGTALTARPPHSVSRGDEKTVWKSLKKHAIEFFLIIENKWILHHSADSLRYFDSRAASSTT
jgi:hypothetical protein